MKFGRLHFIPYSYLQPAQLERLLQRAIDGVFAHRRTGRTLAAALPSLATGTNYTNFRAPARFLDGRIFRIGFNVSW